VLKSSKGLLQEKKLSDGSMLVEKTSLNYIPDKNSSQRISSKNTIFQDDTPGRFRQLKDFAFNPFFSVFAALRDIRSRGRAENNRKEDASKEEDEKKNEVSSEGLLHRLMEVILVLYARNKDIDRFRR
jgi:hypothetical protein